jgi:hypothetical protein
MLDGVLIGAGVLTLVAGFVLAYVNRRNTV